MSKNENEYEGEWVYDEYEGYIYNSNVGSYVKHAVIKDGKKLLIPIKNCITVRLTAIG